ncbi:MAG TPA: DUF4139 domain-containing protein [Sedimentisphaerales bacterium]|nr:DUF4139 domain-containing protein [Sedimentisphaerales bacterium]
MKQPITPFLLVFMLGCPVVLGRQESQRQPPVSLTVYNNDFAVVSQLRPVEFEKGLNTIKFTDIASAIDPATVGLEFVNTPASVSILEQSYEYDLASMDSILMRCIGKNITVVLKGSGADTGRVLTGTLLAVVENNPVLKSQEGKIEILNTDSIEAITLKESVQDLVTQPTLVWLVTAGEKGRQLCRLTYMTAKMNWSADYSAVVNNDQSKLDFTGWVTIDNRSGAAYENAGIKLIAGQVRRGPERLERFKGRALALAEEMAAPAFEERAFAEYHLYTLDRPATIDKDRSKRMQLIDTAMAVPAANLYIYDRSVNTRSVQAKIEFENRKENNLGIPLPAGTVRVYKKDRLDESLQFIGEDQINHLPKNEKVTLYIGSAFDIKPEYTLLDSTEQRRMRRQGHKVELRNAKAQAVEVFVDEKFPGHVNWTIEQSTHKYEKTDARTARFTVKVAADSTSVLEYTASQTW